MSTAQMNDAPLATNQAAALLRQVTLSQATCLAREGSYSAAEELLSGLLAAETPDVATLDLLARVRVQQGALLDAASLWRKVQQIDPHHLGAAAGLERLRAAHRKPLWLQPLLVSVVGLGVILACALIFNWQSRRQGAANTQLQQRLTELAKAEAITGREQVQSVLAQVEAISASQAKAETTLAALGNFSEKLDSWAKAQEARAQVSSNQIDSLRQTVAHELAAQHDASAQSLSNQVAGLRAAVDRERILVAEIEQRRAAVEKLQSDYRALEIRHEALARERGIAVRPPGIAVNVPGVTTSVSGNEIIVGFDGGLFDHGTHFKIGAKERLLAVAKILSQSGEPLKIQVVGFADDDRAFLQWTALWESSLSLERATSVANYIVQLGLIQPAKITVAGSTAEDRPFASDSARSRASNRTVTIHVFRSNPTP